MTDVTYTAHIAPDEDGVAYFWVNRAIPGGVDGPFTSPMPCAGMTLAQITEELAKHRYTLIESWQVTQGFDGIRLSAKVLR